MIYIEKDMTAIDGALQQVAAMNELLRAENLKLRQELARWFGLNTCERHSAPVRSLVAQECFVCVFQERAELREEAVRSLAHHGQFYSDLMFALTGTREPMTEDTMLATARMVREAALQTWRKSDE